MPSSSSRWSHRYALHAARVLFLGSLLCLACSTDYTDPDFLVSSSSRERITEAAFRYNNALRFGNLEMAIRWVEPDQRNAFLTLFSDTAVNPIRFTDVEISTVEPGPGDDEARVNLNVRYYRLPYIQEITFAQEQHWRYDARDRCWYVTPDMDAYSASESQRPAKVSSPR